MKVCSSAPASLAQPYSLRRILVEMRLAHRASLKWIRPRAIRMANVAWFSGSAGLALAYGLGGTMRESTAGAVMLLNEAAGSVWGDKWKSWFSVQTGIFIAGLCAQRWPEITSDPWVFALHAGLVLANLPTVLEPFLKDKAQKKLAAFRQAGRHLVKKKAEQAQNFALSFTANPRRSGLSSNLVYHTVCIGGILWDWAVHQDPSRTHLLLAYPLWVAGNRLACMSEKRIGGPSLLRKTMVSLQKRRIRKDVSA